MISAVGMQHRHVPQMPGKAQKPAEGQEVPNGKSLDSVGHQAKAHLLDTGDTSANAQGKAAAMIAAMHHLLGVPEQSSEVAWPEIAGEIRAPGETTAE